MEVRRNCLETTGRRPIPVKWVEVNKGDRQRPEVRARLTLAESKHRTTLAEADMLSNTIRCIAFACILRCVSAQS